jgi:hypothetical protein
MAFEKVLRGNVTILLAYPEAFADPEAPVAAELNDLFVYTTNEDAMVFDVSCSILDDYTLNMSDSDTDDSVSICDIGNVSSPTFQNYEGSLDAFRDKDVDDNGIFNLFRDLTLGPDREFYVIKRIGYASTDAFAAGQTISMYGFNTDFPVDLVEDNAMLKHGARFKPNGNLNINYELAA